MTESTNTGKSWNFLLIITVIINHSIYYCACTQNNHFDPQICKLSPEVTAEIQSYLPAVQKLQKEIKSSHFKHKTYKDLKKFISATGNRVTGSVGLENAVSYMYQQLGTPDTGIKSAWKEKVRIPKLTIGKQAAKMILPFNKKFEILPERNVHNTPATGIFGEILVITSLKDVKLKSSKMRGKILLFNFVGNEPEPEVHRKYRIGIKISAKFGASAVLLRSIPHSLGLPHEFTYFKNPPIPVASLIKEDAQFFADLCEGGQEIHIWMWIRGYSLAQSVDSYNVLGDYEGSKFPNEFVVISGHMDNVKVGLGVQDDAYGLFLSLNTIRLLNHAQLQPKRTLRTIFWTSEEYYLNGAYAFIKDSIHIAEFKNRQYRFALEADVGCSKALQYLTVGPMEFSCILNEIMSTLLNFNRESKRNIVKLKSTLTDVSAFTNFSVPIAALGEPANETYWWYRHSRADVMSSIKPNDLDYCLLVYATTAYVLADLENLPNVLTK